MREHQRIMEVIPEDVAAGLVTIGEAIAAVRTAFVVVERREGRTVPGHGGQRN